ncbi:MAG: serine/threonine-protein kinase [Acidobacteria bacterium]|nr:serine/threonine-protein kinase [Acidobacteriota bacterium]
MSLRSSIAHYRIVSKLGEGGMGAVYRATDTKLNRDVAIKVLPDSFTDDPDRLARFTREAQVLASLNHPNIAAIYGVEDRALILELVEGPTLAERIAHGPIPVEESLVIAREMAEALEYAHDRGIVHRDLKPANVKLTQEGQAKVLDFGLAKALSTDLAAGDPASSPTLTMRATAAGLILGTASYMSPEQAKGKPADRRTDIWAFGVLLVEMLTGRAMYTGETISETLASVIKDQPDLSGLPSETPLSIRHLLKRCLDKDPRRRLQAIGEARVALENAAAEGPPAAAGATAAAAQPARRGAPWWLAASAVAIALALAGLLWRATRPVDYPLERFSADLGPEATAGARITAALSPDGTQIAYPVRTRTGTALGIRLLSVSKPTILMGTEGAFDQFFSPDGQWIGFFDGGSLKKVSVQGGATITLCPATVVSRGASWGRDGLIYVTLDATHLSRLPAAGGKPETLTDPEKRGDRSDRWPQVLPGGEHILVTVGTSAGDFDDASIGVYSLRTKRMKIVQRGGYYGRYMPSGHLTFVHQGALLAVPFDLKRLETRGTPAPVLEDVAANTTAGGGQYDFSSNGTFVYLSGTAAESSPMLWMNKSGATQPLLAAQAGRVLGPRLSPDGKLVAYTMGGDLYIYDPARGATSRLTVGRAGATWPVWCPDGKHIAYTALGRGITWARADGSGKPTVVYGSQTDPVITSISPDGKVLAFHDSGRGRDIFTLRMNLANPDEPTAGKPEPFLASPGDDVEAAFSPDGHWLAYTTSESGVPEVFVRPFPKGMEGAGQVQISVGPGRFPVWSRAAKQIFYLTLDGQITMVPYAVNGRTFSPGKPELWSQTRIRLTGNDFPYDLAPDGKRFVVFQASQDSGAQTNLHLVFLLHFFDELKRRMP